ncbi:hypothetical protein GALL_385040 [mine drainage metagenome]|uniref:Uncharacterized protein n=1 Tax=mine drainage metagenome TaxID=410659 RepID=A0A1J5QII5_9ZZZZ
MAATHRVVRTHLDRRRVVEGRGVARDVLGHVDDHRAGTPAARDVEGLLHRQCEIAHVLDQEVVLDDRSRDADGVALLEGVEPDRRHRHLAGDDDHGDRIHVGGRDAGHRVGRAGARGDERHADVAGGAGVAVGRVHGGLLVANEHVLDLFLLVKLVVDVQHRAAGVAPDVADAFGLQAAHDDLGAGDFGARGSMGGLRCGRRGRLEFSARSVHVLHLVEFL